MDCYVTVIFLFLGLSLGSCSPFPLREYYYVGLEMSWTDAQSYCRMHYSDLATFESADDQSRLQPAAPGTWFWIGLSDDPKSWKGIMGTDANSWRWTRTGETSKTGYQNWDGSQPNNHYGKEGCVTMARNGRWMDALCDEIRTFACYSEINQTQKTFFFIINSRTWPDARDYCREHYTDLAFIENSEENDEVFSVKLHRSEVWIGLYRELWTWSDKTRSSFTSWKHGSPNNEGLDQFCVSQNSDHKWEDDECGLTQPFICHQVLKFKTLVKMTFETDADYTDSATNTQILQQMDAVLKSPGRTDVKLQWTIQPRKQEKLIK